MRPPGSASALGIADGSTSISIATGMRAAVVSRSVKASSAARPCASLHGRLPNSVRT
jgi:hypothetical protein